MSTLPSTVCVFLGPYRNLTTLTATALHFHPNVQVLEHGIRDMEGDAFKFLSSEGSMDFQTFVAKALRLSKQPTIMGGGPITNTFTFGSDLVIGEVERLGLSDRPKGDIRCLAWKESMRVSVGLIHMVVDWDKLFEDNGRLRFLLPIRSPIDCAISNSRQAKWVLFDGINDNDARMVLRGVLAQHAWFIGLQHRFPGRFFRFYEYDMGEGMLRWLAEFLSIPWDGEWAESATRIWDIKRPYRVSEEFLCYYHAMVNLHFSAWPAEAERMEYFINLADRGEMPARDWTRKKGSE